MKEILCTKRYSK